MPKYRAKAPPTYFDDNTTNLIWAILYEIYSGQIVVFSQKTWIWAILCYFNCSLGETPGWTTVFFMPQTLPLHQPCIDCFGSELEQTYVDGMLWALGPKTKPTMGLVDTGLRNKCSSVTKLFCYTHRIHVWYIYLHLPYRFKPDVGKYIYHTIWILWDYMFLFLWVRC